jgi:DNA-binding CsgD family transcriptional regulator
LAAANASAASLADPAPDGLFEADLVLRALAWFHLASGEPERARQWLGSAVELAHDLGQSGVELSLRHDLLRMGSRDQVGPILSLGQDVEGPGPAAMLAHADALRLDDGNGLLAAAQSLAECGATIAAAEAALAAEVALRRKGHPRGATRAARRAAQLRAQVPDIALPTLVAAAATPVPLTAREREVAELAARRLSAAEIAERLVLSRRTVENHLQRIYTKLGIAGRAELEAALRR